MPVIHDKKMRAAVRVLFNKWAREYKADLRKETSAYNNTSFAKDHIEFIQRYVGYMLLDGTAPSNLERIERFLSMQKVVNDNAELEIHFEGGTAIEATVFVEDIRDVDIADVYSFTDFEEILVYKQRHGRWSRKSARAFVRALKEDVGFDGIKGVFKSDFSGSKLHIKCRFIEE